MPVLEIVMIVMIVMAVIAVVMAIAAGVMSAQAQQRAEEASDEAKRQAHKFQIPRNGTDQSLGVIYGTREMAPVKVFASVADKIPGQVKNEFLWVILIWGVGKVDAIEDVYIKDEKWRSGRFLKDDGSAGEWSGCAYQHHLGGDKATIPSWFTPLSSNLELTDDELAEQGETYNFKDFDFTGIVCTFLQLQHNEAYTYWGKGYPSIKAKVRGRKLYDFRNGQTRYSENPIVQAYDLLTDTQYGKGVAPSLLDLESFKVAADHCDQKVITPDGEKALFTSNIILDTAATFKSNLKILLGNCRAYMPPATRLKVVIEDAGTHVYTINDDTLTSALKSGETDANSRYNQIIIRYPNKADRYYYQEVIFPPIDSALDKQWLSEDNDKRFTKEFQMEAITDTFEAMQAGEVLARLSRQIITAEADLVPSAAALEPLDIVAVHDDLRGWDGKYFRVMEVQDGYDHKVKVKLIEYQHSSYVWSDKAALPDIPDTSYHVPKMVSVPADLQFTVLDDGLDQAQLSWALVEDYWVKTYVWQILDDQSVIVKSGTTQDHFALIDNLPAGNYTARVRAQREKQASDWAVLPIILTEPATPTSCTIEPTGGALRLFPQPKPLAFGAEFEFYASDSEQSTGLFLGRGISLSHNDLHPDTIYFYKIRAVNKYGQSTFIHVQGKTNLDQSALLDRLKNNLTTTELNQETRELFDRLKTGTTGSLPDSIKALDKELDTAIESINIEIEKNTGSIETEKTNREAALKDAKNYLEATRNELEKNVDDAQSQLLEVTSNFANLQQQIEIKTQQQAHLISAVIDIDEQTGTITNKAYAYADNKFTEAGLTIDGVKAAIDLEAKKLEKTDYGLQQAQADISLQAGLIAQRATYAEINSSIATAVDALTPAYSWQFNDNAEGFSGTTQADGALIFNKDQTATKTGISLNADDNPSIRARVKCTGDWQGIITNAAGEFTLTLPSPTPNEWEVITFDAKGTAGYTGTITDIQLKLGDVELDYLTIGKQGANDLALQDITARTTTLESEIDAENARWSQYMTNTAFNNQAVTHTNFNQVFDLADGTYGLKALKAEIDTKGVISKATSAYDWIDLSQGTAGQWLANYLASDGGINNRLNTVEQTADALSGTIKKQISSITGIEQTAETQAADQLEKEFSLHQLRTGQSIGNAKIAQAESTLQAQSNELEATSANVLNLQTAANDANAQIQTLKTSASNASKALAQAQSLLTADISTAKDDAINTAQAKLDAIETTLTDADKALAQSITDLNASFTQKLTDETTATDSKLSTLETTLTTADKSIAQTVTDLETTLTKKVGDNETASNARFETVEQTQTDIDAAIAQQKTDLQADFNQRLDDEAKTTAATLDAVESTMADTEKAIAQSQTKLASTFSVAEQAATEQGAQQLEQEAALHNMRIGERKSSDRIALAEHDLKTLATESEALAVDVLTLQTAAENSESSIESLSASISNSIKALAQIQQTLTAKISDTESTVIDTLRAESGYVCIDASGNITDDKTSVACLAANHSWIQQSIAESLRSVAIATGDNETATISQVMQAFRREDTGELSLIGGIVYDVNGRISGIVGTADNENTDLEFIADKIKFIKPGTTDAVFEWDSNKNSLVFKGSIAAGSSIESPVILSPEINIDPETGARLGNFSVNSDGDVRAKGAILDEVTINNAEGITIFSSGTGIDSSMVNNLGDLAAKNLTDLALSTYVETTNIGDLAALDKITDSTYIDFAVINTLLAGQIITAQINTSSLVGDTVRFGSIPMGGKTIEKNSKKNNIIKINDIGNEFSDSDLHCEIEFWMNPALVTDGKDRWGNWQYVYSTVAVALYDDKGDVLYIDKDKETSSLRWYGPDSTPGWGATSAKRSVARLINLTAIIPMGVNSVWVKAHFASDAQEKEKYYTSSRNCSLRVYPVTRLLNVENKQAQ